MKGEEINTPGKNMQPVCDEDENSGDQGKERKTTANLTDVCQDLLVSRGDGSRHLWRKYTR